VPRAPAKAGQKLWHTHTARSNTCPHPARSAVKEVRSRTSGASFPPPLQGPTQQARRALPLLLAYPHGVEKVSACCRHVVTSSVLRPPGGCTTVLPKATTSVLGNQADSDLRTPEQPARRIVKLKFCIIDRLMMSERDIWRRLTNCRFNNVGGGSNSSPPVRLTS